MQIRIFMNVTEKVEPEHWFVSLAKYHNGYYTLDILYILIYYVYSAHSCIKILINE